MLSENPVREKRSGNLRTQAYHPSFLGCGVFWAGGGLLTYCACVTASGRGDERALFLVSWCAIVGEGANTAVAACCCRCILTRNSAPRDVGRLSENEQVCDASRAGLTTPNKIYLIRSRKVTVK